VITDQIVKTLKLKKIYLATVESCTGGFVANQITNTPGASGVFFGGWVVYDNEAKGSLLGIPPRVIKKHGAVSPQVAKLLAERGLNLVLKIYPKNNIVCISTTGIAGPTGGSNKKPVGLCYVGIAASKKKTQVIKLLSKKNQNRIKNKHFFANEALKKLLLTCK